MKWVLLSPSPDGSGNRSTDRVSQLLKSTQPARGRAQSGVAVWPQRPCSKSLGLVSKNLQKVQALTPKLLCSGLTVPPWSQLPGQLLRTAHGLCYPLLCVNTLRQPFFFLAFCSQRKHHCLKYRLQQRTVFLSAQHKTVIMYSWAMPRFQSLPTTRYVRDAGRRLHHVLMKIESPAPGTK